MTNGEKFVTAQERAKAFFRQRTSAWELEDAFAWLDIEADVEKPETIDDVIKDMEKVVEMMRKRESEGATLLDLSVIFDKFLNRVIAAHNRVAKAVGESEANNG